MTLVLNMVSDSVSLLKFYQYERDAVCEAILTYRQRGRFRIPVRRC
jgi:hypothetical protein